VHSNSSLIGGDPKVAFVTGAAQGIGLATAVRPARDGFCLVAMDRNGDRLEGAVADFGVQGLNVIACAAGICDRASVAACVSD
jgi:3-oxoacyl-[acyl-carrier protein] reductase